MGLSIDTVTKRRHRRHAVDTDCAVGAPERGRGARARTVDASYDGLLVRSPPGREYALGDRVRLRLRLPETEVWVDAEAVVRRIVRGRRAGDPGPALGLYVHRMNGLDRVLFASVLRGYPTATAGRGARRDYARIVARIAGLAGR